MNYILVVGYKNGDVVYHGPYPTKYSAEQDALLLSTTREHRWHVAVLSLKVRAC